ncbi:MAG TPA: prepilin-type N-terminal cleavage/methylation domain-containing protein [Fibrobacteria bacterium]|nr:prepilin-type N-terminal cleavage/methylation domain-containing protein [Fibrobacteria bacterium]
MEGTSPSRNDATLVERAPDRHAWAEKGFTLVEVLAVLIIIAILAAVGTPIYLKYVEGARAADAQTTIGSIVTAEKIHYQKYGHYAPLEELQKKKVLKVDEATNTNWSFETDANGEAFTYVRANSKEEMAGGSGKQVEFQVNTGVFSGYGQD